MDMITANGILVWFAQGFFMGVGFWLAGALIWLPTRRLFP